MTRSLWALAALAVALSIVKFFVADIYRVSSGSMRPTIFGGKARPDADTAPFSEALLLHYDDSRDVERFEIVVVKHPDGEAVVKRVVGLPNEGVRILDGDLVLDGERLPHDAPRPEPIPIFDDRLLSVAEFFWHKEDGDTWTRDESGAWRLDAAGVPLGHDEGVMAYNAGRKDADLRDDYFDENDERVEGLRTINDAILECEFALDQAAGRVLFRLVERGDTFEVRIRPNPERTGGSHLVELVHRTAAPITLDDPKGGETVLESEAVEIALHRYQRLFFANVDNHVIVGLPDLGFELPVHTYAENTTHPRLVDRAPGADHHIGSRVAFGGQETRARFRSIRILRDLFYTSYPSDGYGVATEERVGPDEVFLLGDNSVTSNDSRSTGPMPLRELVGRPLAVVWPLRRIRKLADPRPLH